MILVTGFEGFAMCATGAGEVVVMLERGLEGVMVCRRAAGTEELWLVPFAERERGGVVGGF